MVVSLPERPNGKRQIHPVLTRMWSAAPGSGVGTATAADTVSAPPRPLGSLSCTPPPASLVLPPISHTCHSSSEDGPYAMGTALPALPESKKCPLGQLRSVTDAGKHGSPATLLRSLLGSVRLCSQDLLGLKSHLAGVLLISALLPPLPYLFLPRAHP